jgi:catechol 2,3-dioxygenase-like lactoylglutathione lyase family enzyme
METASAAVSMLDHLVIATPDPERTAALYGARLGLDMKLDRTIAAIGTRFLFFRTGGLVFEIIHRIKDGRSDGPDKIYGVSWRVADVQATGPGSRKPVWRFRRSVRGASPAPGSSRSGPGHSACRPS